MKKSQKGFIIPLILIILALGIGGYFIYKKYSVPQTLNNMSTRQVDGLASTTPLTDQFSTFSSPLFGVTFQYDSQTGVDLEGNTAYIYSLQSKDTHTGDYIQVLNKNSLDSLSNAIKKSIDLPPYCGVRTDTHSNFSVQGGNVITASVFSPGGVQVGTNHCDPYEDSGSPGFFFEDTTHPQYFYFIRGGSGFGGIPGTIDWVGTLHVATTTTTISPQIPGWQTYDNFGIRFEYPEKFNTDYATLNVRTSVEKVDTTKLDSNGCYPAINAAGKQSPDTLRTINGIKFCFTTSGDVGAGQLYTDYNYMTVRNGNAYTVDYSVHTSNGCGVYQNDNDINSPDNLRYRECLDFGKNYNTLVTQPIQKSIGTLTFTN